MKTPPDAKALVLCAWTLYLDTHDLRDRRIAMMLTELAVAGDIVPESIIPPNDGAAPQGESTKARKRKAKRGLIRLDAAAPILAQVRAYAR